jgi:hypothetical protein
MSATQYRFSLNSRKKYDCPDCKGRKKLARYIDTITGEYIADHVGKCDRADNCGYHYPPKQFFTDNPNLSNNEDWKKSDAYKMRLATPSVSKPPKAVSLMPSNVFKGSLKQYDKNSFTTYLHQLFGAETTNKLIARYYIGTSNYQFRNKDFPNYTSPNGATIFWQIDINGNIRAGKIMLYNPETGKRIKEPFNHLNWAHVVLKYKGFKEYNDFNLKQCLFGEHLLSVEPTKAVAIVESEKTAIIASVYLPQYLWLACGSLTNLTAERCEALTGRKVVLYPDLKAFDKWNDRAKELSKIAHFTVSDLLEREATDTEKQKGFDLADYLIRFDPSVFQDSDHRM